MAYRKTKSGDKYIKAAKAAVGKSVTPGYCLKYNRTWAGISAKYADANDSMAESKNHKYKESSCPVGAAIYWKRSPSGTKYGHIACYIGNGKCITTDSPRGKVGIRSVTELTKSWGMSTPYWGEEINDVRVVEYYKPKKVKKMPPTQKFGSRGKYVGVIQNKLGIKDDKIFGKDTKAAVKKYQAKHGLKEDGVVGKNTWAKMGY